MILGTLERQLNELMTNPLQFALWALIFVIAIGLHEWGHAVVADRCGDPTPRSQGRVTLNPLAHLDPLGTIAILFVGFGWGKPVMVQPALFRNKRWDDVKVSVAGVTMNLSLVVFFGCLHRILMSRGLLDPTLEWFLQTGLRINVMLMVFNLIPIGPLDGASIVKNLLPLRQAYDFEQFNRSWGMLLMIVLLFTGVAYRIVLPVQVGAMALAGMI